MWNDELLASAEIAAGNAPASLKLAAEFGHRLPAPGAGHTALRWQALASVSACDLTAGRVLEAHTDALAILAEAGQEAAGGGWGVFAAEMPGLQLVAAGSGAEWTVSGTKPWCSLAGALDHALVTAAEGSGRRLYWVDLHDNGVEVSPPAGWVARGLRAVPSGPVHFDRTPARPVGEPGWYLTRPGFAWGGIGVAACWFGGAVALAGQLHTAARKRGGDLALLAVGRVDVALYAARECLIQAARTVDTGDAEGESGSTLALRVRSVVAAAAEETLTQVGHVLGPSPLAFDETYARRVADLTLYVRQHHADRDLAALGARVLGVTA